MPILSLLCCLRNTHNDHDDSSNGATTISAKTAAKKASAKPEPYSEQHARELFKTYEDPDSPGEIGPEGFEKLCTDMEISLEGALPLVLAWQMHATEMAKFKESEWMQGTGELRASNLHTLALALHDLEDLLLLDKPPVQPSGSVPKKKGATTSGAAEPYNRNKYYEYAADKNKAFRLLYNFCFALAKPPTSRNIDMDTASAFWSVLVAPKYPIMKDILEFINEKGSYKGVTKDLWSMMLDFCKTMQPDLSNYSTDEAWPSMLDDFVAWKKPAGAAQEGNVNVEDDN
ncbi:DUF298-domain-containing protein [Lentinus tigrinus ALCF2SS1-7]|uniref:Defective in cullin neddylation protein n=1 Tax=Lentinus tigrinus ALCF2SS1-6 TaxID=1328759 RepID=A0A5C2S7Y6_9APHY|nr:DUF298-domain-containing protein [Lentinus tigrinus ALCF2SS1-6]RPD73521.1 DUF298-domain-containing protein [Lentinus tigrinus ALCF2SS1-7]